MLNLLHLIQIMGLKHLVTMGGVLLDWNMDLLADSPAKDETVDEAVELNNETDIEILKSDENEAMKPTDSSIPLTVDWKKNEDIDFGRFSFTLNHTFRYPLLKFRLLYIFPIVPMEFTK